MGSMVVKITRVPFSGDWFTLTLPNGFTEELEPDETRAWFKARGTKDTDKLEMVLDDVWNFGDAQVTIDNWIEPKIANKSILPKI